MRMWQRSSRQWVTNCRLQQVFKVGRSEKKMQQTKLGMVNVFHKKKRGVAVAAWLRSTEEFLKTIPT